MKRAAEAGFQVADHRIDPPEIGQILGMAAINDYRLVHTTHFRNSTKAGQPIGNHLTHSSQGLLGSICDCCKGEGFHLGHLDVDGMASIIKRHGGDDRNLVL